MASESLENGSLSLVCDPHVPWDDGESPYRLLAARLAEGGLNPSVTNREVQDILFDLLGKPLSAAERRAWDELRLPQARLLVDFLHYTLEESRDDSLPVEALSRLPIPVETPSFDSFARITPDLGRIAQPPEALPTSTPQPRPPNLGEPPPLDLGPIVLPLEDDTGEDHE